MEKENENNISMVIYKDFEDCEDLTFIERGLLSIYKYYTIMGNGYCYMSTKTICRKLNISRITLWRLNKKFKDAGYIDLIEKEDKNGVIFKGVDVSK